jgi:quinoprotein glucose dehydrogenase
MILFLTKNKFKFSILFLFLILFSYYFFLNNNCLNFTKLVKSYIDLGYSNIKPCYIGSAKSLIREKAPKLFNIGSDLKRYYFSNFNKDILDMKTINNYEEKELELFPNIVKIKNNNGIKGILNTDYQTPFLSSKENNKTYISYVRQNKDNSNSKFYNNIKIKKINNINKPTLSWKHVAINSSEKDKWKRMVETSPIYFKGKIFYLTSDFRFIALNATDGKLLWQKELLHAPSQRGFLTEENLSNEENIYLPVGSKIFKIDAKNGNLRKEFGNKGNIDIWTAASPFIYKNNIIVVSRNRVVAFDKITGKEKFAVKIFKGKKFIGALPWGGAALDEERGLIFLTTGNPIPKVYGAKRAGENEGSNSLIAINLINKNIEWQFKETYHDMWNLDVAFPPILTNLNINNKNYDVVIVLTKIGNFIMLERLTGEPIFDIDLVKAPRSKILGEMTSPYQLAINKPEPITKFSWDPEDMSQLNNKTKEKFLNNLTDYEYGLFVPPYPNKTYIYMAMGPIWEGATIDQNKKKLFAAVNHTPAKMRVHLRSLWPHSKIVKNFENEISLYNNKCASCHGKNRNGIYKVGTKPYVKAIETKYIPSLVGYHLFDELSDKIKNYENYKKKHKEDAISKTEYKKLNELFKKWDNDLLKNNRISVNEKSSLFVDENGNFMTNYPQGELVSYDLKNGTKDWSVPFGYENGLLKGTFSRGGLSLTNDGTLFATGTPDKKIFAYNSKTGKEIWSFKMDIAGSAPPTIYTHNSKIYMSVIATGGYNHKYPDIGTTLYTFELN